MLRSFSLGLILSGGMLLGCSTPNAQLASCQEDKEQLLATIREQRDSNRALHAEVASLESRLDESEKELAKIGKPAARLSSRPSAEQPPIKNSHLPWREPAEPQKPAGKAEKLKTSSQSASDLSLAAMARGNKRLSFDPRSGTATVNAPVSFAEGSAVLSAVAKRELDDVAKWLRTDEGADLQVVVSGLPTREKPISSTKSLAEDRAQAVADYLDSHGIAGERLQVAPAASRVVAAGGSTPASRSAVQIVVAGPDASVAGWNGRTEALRR